MCSTAFAGLAQSKAKSLGHSNLPLVVVEHPFGVRTRDEIRALAQRCAAEIVSTLCEAPAATVENKAASGTRPQLIDAPDDFEEFNRFFFERKWSDGLPVTPPTPERVERMLKQTRRAPGEFVAKIAPFGAATVEGIAINAVMAGCYPEYLPVMIAAAEAMGEKQFNLGTVQSTTQPTTTWLIINGPIAQRLKVNGGISCLGSGAWANATLGRAARLIAMNIGGAIPGEGAPATHGFPGKLQMCCAENEAESPWEPLHVERGFARDTSTVTVVSAKGIWSLLTTTQDVDDLLKVLGNSMMSPAGGEYRTGGWPTLVLAPEHAQVFARAGWSKAEFKRRVWEASKMPLSRMAAVDQEGAQDERRAELGEFSADTMLPISAKPEDITVLVAGGPGQLSLYIPCQGRTGSSVTRAIDE